MNYFSISYYYNLLPIVFLLQCFIIIFIFYYDPNLLSIYN